MNLMIVEKPGMFSLLQDLGRTGWQRYGVPVNGPMTEWSHRVANAVLGNPEDAAVLECTLTGPVVRFTQDTLLALSGADMRVTGAGRRLPFDCAVLLRRGVALEFGERLRGARTYLAVRGGFASEPVLGSRSTYVRGAFGGHQGRALRRNDRVEVTPTARDVPTLALERRLIQSGLPWVCAQPVAPAHAPAPADRLRLIPGPQWKAFSAEAQRRLLGQPYLLSAQSDRMGYRLQGAALALRRPLEMVSEATSFGTVQVPPDGQPIVLMADRQSAGGYPKIGYVAACDLPALAQALPGDALRFEAIAQDAAERLLLDREARLGRVRDAAVQALGLPLQALHE
ncbi:MAG: KipI antagonist [Paracidovorax wautersii]|uniref:KipI antagonist n=1 Tax=Paracidovorax wautersii TaxID=1177982 RepID=A0A7V8JPV6_9BURK|nr:MAG: KipI antagonist [Paracidovorax wautersii]